MDEGSFFFVAITTWIIAYKMKIRMYADVESWEKAKKISEKIDNSGGFLTVVKNIKNISVLR
jgi:hypothetical protein